ncbi:hypothetical protein DPMN_142358 [Dreissena polymorpha]|uniref:C-type lectin domain-containing protein n=2 Tax=Dreissena polymorpha TaxID=45954 RepID=A0A9D4JM47_DREPO|nr:hypothetical protein DPMN_142358 [Dreissena polymorpha]
MWKRSVSIVLCLLISGCVSYYTTCKDGWVPFSGSCYLFRAQGMSFTEAEHFCRQHENSHLVHVDDALENSFLKDRMRAYKDAFWWVGLTDDDIEGVWKWYDTDEMPTFTDFMPGDGGDHNKEDCATFGPGPADYSWVDASCSGPISVLCEARGHECEETIVG